MNCGITMSWSHALYFLLVLIMYISTETMPMFKFNPPPMRYVDKEEKDLFFDRVVFPLLAVKNYSGNGKQHTLYSSGVLISEDRVLTSYNPFRDTIKSAQLFWKTGICYVESRGVSLNLTDYIYECELITCGRQVIPMNDKDLTSDQWHGPEKKLSPVHDLMVLKLKNPLDIWEQNASTSYTYEDQFTEEVIKNGTFLKAGPLLTKLANTEDVIEDPIKFVALGLKTENKSKEFIDLDVVYFDNYEDLREDCNDWLPNNWGYFICIKNDYIGGFGAGALLFSGDTLFGIGSFTMFRESESTLVFTDVRPYSDLINNTCTENDLKIY